ncbi:MAG: hypothetical protein QOJ16_299 [Acidobacteriota bacterium]|jgi:uncharacterized membrane protein YphA (DoxX/SURF4 family)|nr:hypothetical protein [Acidobacteriota bacterium]
MAEPIRAPEPWQDRRQPARRLGFRFLFSYLLLYGFELALAGLPGTGWLQALWLGIWKVAVSWVGRHVLHLGGGGQEIATVATGSGDRTFDYVQVLSMLALAALAALAWTALDRRRREERDRRLYEGLRIFVRYTLALTLLAYGMSNVFKVQFPFPAAERLQERIGDSSPLALFKVFMGYSATYTFSIGASELLAGLLLLFRRTTTLGALVTLGILVNEVALAFCYDVPVKLLSSHLLLMTLFLLAPEARRLVDGIVLDRPTLPEAVAPPFSGCYRTGRLALKALVVGSALLATTERNLELAKELRRRPPLADPSKYLLVTHGIHVIEDSPINR